MCPGGAGRDQAVRVSADVEPRAILVEPDNIGHDREQLAHAVGVAAALPVAPRGDHKPERGIHGVVLRWLIGIRKHVGDQALIAVLGKQAEDLQCGVEAFGCQRQARQRDHGVPPPIGKPWITRQQSQFVRPAPRDERIASNEQCLAHRVRLALELFAPQPLGGDKRLGADVVLLLGRDDDVGGLAAGNVKSHLEQREQVFLELETAILFDGIGESVIPVGSRFDGVGFGVEVQAWKVGVRLHLGHTRAAFDGRIDRIVAMRERLGLAESEQRSQLQLDRAMRAEVAVAEHDRILPVDEQHALLDLKLEVGVAKRRPRTRPELGLDVESVREDCARVQIGAQVKLLVADHDTLFEFRQQHVALDGRVERRDEQAVLTARVGADDRRGRGPAEAIGLQPLLGQCVLQILALRLVERHSH